MPDIAVNIDSGDVSDQYIFEPYPKEYCYLFLNYNIFIPGEYMFVYFEYVGDNYKTDMKMIDEGPCSMEWEKLCNKCQLPFVAGERVSWSDMEQIFHMD